MIKKLVVVAVLISIIALFFIYDGQAYLNFDSIKMNYWLMLMLTFGKPFSSRVASIFYRPC